MSKTIGERIKEQRLSKDLTQEELGRRIGVAKATINKYETGVIQNLKRPTIEKLAAALSTTPDYLMGWSDNTMNVGTNNGMIGSNSGSIIFENTARALSKEELELLRIYANLSVKGRLELLQTAMRLEEGKF